MREAQYSLYLFSLSTFGFPLSAVFVFGFHLYLLAACSVQRVALFGLQLIAVFVFGL